jgi:hypothetical protein
LFLIEGATHIDLYDGNGVVAAVNKMVPFFKSHLAPANAIQGANAVAAE